MTMLTKQQLDELEPQKWVRLSNAEIGVIARVYLPKLLEENKLLRDRVTRLEARETQLLEANTAEVERRRLAEAKEKSARLAWEEQILLGHKLRKKLIEARHFFSVGGLQESFDE